MPVFDLVCNTCAKKFNRFVVSRARAEALLCPDCGGSMTIPPASFAPRFVGSGFHANDYPSNVDKAVGADAEKRWKAIEERDKQRAGVVSSLKEGETVVRTEYGYEKAPASSVVGRLVPEKSAVANKTDT